MCLHESLFVVIHMDMLFMCIIIHIKSLYYLNYRVNSRLLSDSSPSSCPAPDPHQFSISEWLHASFLIRHPPRVMHLIPRQYIPSKLNQHPQIQNLRQSVPSKSESHITFATLVYHHATVNPPSSMSQYLSSTCCFLCQPISTNDRPKAG